MGFIKTSAELAKLAQRRPELYGAELLMVFWETSPEIASRLLPPPLESPAYPLAVAFMASYPRTNFGPPYLEGALFLGAEFRGEWGAYCLAMPITDDMAMAAGREKWGYPKKLATIEFGREGDRVSGIVERHKVRFFQVHAELSPETPDQELQRLVAQVLPVDGERGMVLYLFKHSLAPDGSGFDYPPRLTRAELVVRPSAVEWGSAKVLLTPSDTDPWAEVEIVRVLGAVYVIGDAHLPRGKVVAEADPAEFMPYSLSRWDW